MNYNRTKYACYLGYASSAIVNNFAPLLYVTFMTTFKLSTSQIGLLIAVNFAVQMLVDFLGARYAVKIGYRRMICAGSLFCASGLVLMGILPYIMNSMSGIIISIFIYAIGGGIMEVLVSPIVEAIPGDNKAATMSMLHSFYAWGQLLVVLLSTLYFVFLGTAGWRWLSIMWAFVPLTDFILFIKAPINMFAEGEKRLPFRKIFTNKIFVMFMIIMLAAGAAEVSVAQWVSAYAEKGLNVSKTLGDLLGTSMFALFMGISRVIYGFFGEKMKLKEYMIFCGFLCIAGYLAATLVQNEIVALIGCGIVGFAVGIMWPGTLSIVAKDFPEGGTAIFGILAMAGDVGCMTGPETVAVVSRYFTLYGSDLKAGLLVSAIFPIVFTVLMILSKKITKNT